MKGRDAAAELRREAPSSAGSGSTVREWLQERHPAAPDALLRHLEVDRSADDTAPADVLEALLSRADRALRDACAGHGERRGAFRLLAADAYLTWACEAALEDEAPSARLREIVARVTRHAEGG